MKDELKQFFQMIFTNEKLLESKLDDFKIEYILEIKEKIPFQFIEILIDLLEGYQISEWDNEITDILLLHKDKIKICDTISYKISYNLTPLYLMKFNDFLDWDVVLKENVSEWDAETLYMFYDKINPKIETIKLKNKTVKLLVDSYKKEINDLEDLKDTNDLKQFIIDNNIDFDDLLDDSDKRDIIESHMANLFTVEEIFSLAENIADFNDYIARRFFDTTGYSQREISEMRNSVGSVLDFLDDTTNIKQKLEQLTDFIDSIYE